MITKILVWAQKNERHIGAVLFVLGFGMDLATFTLLDTASVNKVFIGYLAIGIVSALGSHYFHSHARSVDSFWRKALTVVFPFLVQYATGSLFSGFLILFTESSALSVSWPFLLILALVFLGNEFFRKYKEQLTFQVTLLFFALYAYSIFVVPLVVGAMGPGVFLLSTVAALFTLGLFLGALLLVGRERFKESFKQIAVATTSVIVLVVGSYFLNIMPPLPLTLKDSGIYHSMVRTGDVYTGTREALLAWYSLATPVVHIQGNDSTLYAYSAVYAPIAFSTGVVHRFEQRVNGVWIVRSTIAFPLTGGRKDGYRGYSQMDHVTPGSWRVSVETSSGQVIGRMYVSVIQTATPPVLESETH